MSEEQRGKLWACLHNQKMFSKKSVRFLRDINGSRYRLTTKQAKWLDNLYAACLSKKPSGKTPKARHRRAANYHREIIPEDPKKTVTIYTDGGCSPNPGKGGYAFIIFGEQGKTEGSGSYEFTTNNRMEVMACVHALETLTEPYSVTIYTDSEYVCGAISMLHKYRQKRFLGIKNQDLLERLDEAIKPHKATVRWVKGHAGNEHNNRCDEMVKLAMEDANITNTFRDEYYESLYEEPQREVA